MTRGSIALFLAAGLALGACNEPEVAAWGERRPDFAPSLRWTQTAQPVRFAGDGTLAPGEAAALEAFLDRQGVHYGHSIALRLPGGASPAEAALRRAAVEAVLMRRGLRLAEGTAGAGGPEIVVGRHEVTLPACPDWSKPAGADPYNLPGANFGCASAHNLAVMVADPGDLARGRAAGGSDGTGAALAIERYRTDKVRPLVREGTGE